MVRDAADQDVPDPNVDGDDGILERLGSDEEDIDEDKAADVEVVMASEDEDDGDEAAEDFLTVAGGYPDLHEDHLRQATIDGWEEFDDTAGPDITGDSPDLHPAEDGNLTEEAKAAAASRSPMDLLFYFMPRDMWIEIARQSNLFERQSRPERIKSMLLKYVAAELVYGRRVSVQARAKKTEEYEKELDSFKAITPREIVRVVALQLSRTICQYKRRISDHWATVAKGAVPAGNWNKFMSRHRWDEINRWLHFSDNEDPQAKVDRIWKIRPIVTRLQETFLRAFELGRWMSFDEMVIPSRSSQNRVRIYLKNKPHKFGTKLFALCCAKTNYCKRFATVSHTYPENLLTLYRIRDRIEIYCGDKLQKATRKRPAQPVAAGTPAPTYSGPVAVMRNLKAVFPDGVDRSMKRVIITDREYTSVALALRLKRMGFYTVGTVQPKRLGFPTALKYKCKKTPASIERGFSRVAALKKEPDVKATVWFDKAPVYFISTGVACKETTLKRKGSDGRAVTLPCPELVVTYNKYMGGVDSHDQLRLQRYALALQLNEQRVPTLCITGIRCSCLFEKRSITGLSFTVFSTWLS